jgi:hypothetical protein
MKCKIRISDHPLRLLVDLLISITLITNRLLLQLHQKTKNESFERIESSNLSNSLQPTNLVPHLISHNLSLHAVRHVDRLVLRLNNPDLRRRR